MNHRVSAFLGALAFGGVLLVMLSVGASQVFAFGQAGVTERWFNAHADPLLAPRLSYAEVFTLTKSAPTEIQAGQPLTFTIVIQNQDYESEVYGLVVTDAVPAATTFIVGSMTATPPSGVVMTAPLLPDAGELMTWTIDALGAWGSPTDTITLTFAVSVTLPVTDGTTIRNTAWLSGEHGTAETTVHSQPEVSPAKTVWPASVNPGEVVTYTILLGNIGTGTVTGLRVTDTLPSGARFVAMAPDQKLPDSTGPQVVWSGLGFFTEYWLTFTVSMPTQSGTYSNVVEAGLGAEVRTTGPTAPVEVSRWLNYLPMVCKNHFCDCAYDQYEPNNVPSEAHSLPDNGTLYANFCELTLRDEYQITSTNKPIILDLTNIPAGCDYDLYLYRLPNTNTSVARSQNSGNANEHIVYQPQAGESYIIMVYAYTRCAAGRTNNYKLTYTFK